MIPKTTKKWTFEASTNSKKAGYNIWIVEKKGNQLICNCGGFKWKLTCKHFKQVKNN